MGINSFLSFLKEHHPSLIRKEHISLYAYQRVFVDISSYIYKYLVVYGRHQNRWLNAMIHLIITFKENNVHCVPVFDGKPTKFKEDEIKERKEKRDQATDRISNLESAIKNFREMVHTEEVLAILKKELESADRKGMRTQRLFVKSSSEKDLITLQDIKILESCLAKMKSQVISISSTDIDLLKRMFTSLGVSWLQAEGESEGFCCWLVKRGLGAAIVSCDSDCIIHCVDDFIMNLESDGTVSHIEIDEVLEDLEISSAQLVDYAILMGCDYNRHLKKNKIGPVNALKMIKKYGNIESMPTLEEDPKHGIDKECLLYSECRELFNPTYNEELVIPNHSFDEEECRQLCSQHHLKIDLINRVKKTTNNATIQFEKKEEIEDSNE